jgi:PAS domain S-box-containing protein
VFAIAGGGPAKKMKNDKKSEQEAAKLEQNDQTSKLIASLQESLQRYETILNDLDVYLGETDLEGNITFINDAGCRLAELSRRILIGRHYKTFTDPETAERIRQIYENIYKTGIPAKNVIFEVIDKHGRRRTVDQSVSLIRNTEGVITGFRNVSLDITARKEAENKLTEHRSRLEAIFRSVKDAIITVDPNLIVIEANKSMENICGTEVEEIVGKEFPQCQQHCNQACHEVLGQTLEKKTAIKEYRIECENQHRLQQVVNVSSSPLLDPQGKFMGAVLIIRDITLLREIERELRVRNQFQNLIGRNKTMQDIYSLLEDLANLDTAVLVTGESGTGKELVARALHYSGNRAFKPFVTVNCSALAESLLESELFGHVRGAFTGAIKDKQGRFQAANGGTILLDEIGDISPMIQLKLLRVLQEKEFERVGESTPQKVDVRVIASTNKDLKGKVNRGEFRQDLYYRLKVVEVALPPLRERLEDLPLLVDHFRCSFNERFNKHVEGISNEVLSTFMDYNWPGNVRELEHVMEHAFVLCHGATITIHHLPVDLRNIEQINDLPQIKTPAKKFNGGQDILDALNKTGWNKTKAARLLGISRQTVYRKINSQQFTNK